MLPATSLHSVLQPGLAHLPFASAPSETRPVFCLHASFHTPLLSTVPLRPSPAFCVWSDKLVLQLSHPPIPHFWRSPLSTSNHSSVFFSVFFFGISILPPHLGSVLYSHPISVLSLPLGAWYFRLDFMLLPSCFHHLFSPDHLLLGPLSSWYQAFTSLRLYAA